MRSLQARPAWALPLQWPGAGAGAWPERRARAAERLLKAAILLALISMTVLDRFGLRLSETYSIPPSLMALYGLLAAMVVAGVARLSPRGAIAYVAVASIAGLSALMNGSLGRYVSVRSFLLLVVLYAPFCFTMAENARARRLWPWTLNAFMRFAVFLALAGIAQFFVQFVYRPPWLFDYSAYIPHALSGFAGYARYAYSVGGAWVKSNGFFLREPSGFSFITAFALLCELRMRRRKWAVALLALSVVLSYSGSGLLTLAVGLVFPLGKRSLMQIAAAAALAVIVFVALGKTLDLSYTLDRVHEFGERGTSAYCRFVRPGRILLSRMGTEPWSTLVGYGPGTMQTLPKCEDKPRTVETTFGKVLFEEGLLGMLAFGALMTWAINRRGVPTGIKMALAVYWLFLGGFLLDPYAALLIYLVCAMWPENQALGAARSGAGT